jgi:predicted DNA-binding protein (UPF0251 family)
MKKNQKQGVGRPRLRRHVRFDPKVDYFKPRGVPLSELEVVELTREELEALRLSNLKGMGQTECAAKMKTSQSTLQRILFSARKKITDALINGKAIQIIKG